MIVLRALQGFFGGVLIPLAFTITMTMLPRSKQPIGLAMFALSATFAPAIGPTIGGYLTETYGWQYIFYVNLVPGAIMLAALLPSLPRAPMQLGLLRQGDWPGIATLAIGLASLQTVLEEGNKDDWFGSPFIVRLSLVAAVALVAVHLDRADGRKAAAQPPPAAAAQLRSRQRCQRHPRHGAVWLGVSAAQLSVADAGLQLAAGRRGVRLDRSAAAGADPVRAAADASLRRAPAGRSRPRAVRRQLLHEHRSNHDYSGPQLLLANLVRAIGQALVMTPLSVLATGGIERDQAGSASALFNMMRNLGGSVGIAALETLLTKREQFHSAIITPSVSLLNEATRHRLAMMQQYFMSSGTADPATAWHDAVVAVGRAVRAQAYFLAYGDTFFLMGASLLLALVAAVLMRQTTGGGAGAH